MNKERRKRLLEISDKLLDLMDDLVEVTEEEECEAATLENYLDSNIERIDSALFHLEFARMKLQQVSEE